MINSSISDWQGPWVLQKQILSIAIVTVILFVLCLIYYIKVRKLKENEISNGYVLLVEIYINYIRNLINEILGPKFEKVTPFFILLFSYICLSNIIGIFGFDNPTSSYTVTFSLALVSFLGIWIVGLKYQKLSYLKGFCFKITTKNNKQIPIMLNPLEIVGNITPIVSLSFRLWGNITAGTLIVSLWLFFTESIWNHIPIFGIINILGGLTLFPLNIFFDVASGIIQALVFTMLTMIYWTMAKGINDDHK